MRLAMILAAMASLLMHSSAVAPGHRRGLLLLTAACLAPLGATVAYDFGLGPGTVSLVPIILVVAQGVPPVRYNATDPTNIKLEENSVQEVGLETPYRKRLLEE